MVNATLSCASRIHSYLSALTKSPGEARRFRGWCGTNGYKTFRTALCDRCRKEGFSRGGGALGSCQKRNPSANPTRGLELKASVSTFSFLVQVSGHARPAAVWRSGAAKAVFSGALQDRLAAVKAEEDAELQRCICGFVHMCRRGYAPTFFGAPDAQNSQSCPF